MYCRTVFVFAPTLVCAGVETEKVSGTILGLNTLKKMLDDAHIDATPVIVVREEDKPLHALQHSHVVFLPVSIHGGRSSTCPACAIP